MVSKNPVTPAGYRVMENELSKLKKVDRIAVSRDIEEARKQGDLSENAEYHAAREKQAFIEARIRYFEDQISRAEVIDSSSFTSYKVMFGAMVTLLDEDEDEVIYRIVGEYEADLERGLISYHSPVARAIIGRSVGDEIEVKTPSKILSYVIKDVNYQSKEVKE